MNTSVPVFRLARPRWVLCAVLALAVCGLSLGPASAAIYPWSDISELSIPTQGMRIISANAYRTVELNRAELETFFATVPMERTAEAVSATTILTLPMPDGTDGRFRIVESPIMHPDLAARYPEIRTYAGVGLDDTTARARLDLTPAGFHAQILTSTGIIYIDPFQMNDDRHYAVFHRSEYIYDPARFVPEQGPFDEDGSGQRIIDSLDLDAEGQASAAATVTLRTYRLAIGATGEYTTFHGGSVGSALAAINTAMNRINGIYERDLAIRMELVANNDDIIYTNGATDPYSNTNGVAMLTQNQTTCDGVIGSANYDIGHVFSTGGGGVANLAVVCRAGSKARGVTGLNSPVGDVFYVDFVAHEMGHQWAGTHSFNAVTGNCCCGNRTGSTAYEPGSGSTIMAYAGICGSQNTQSNSDDYFHLASLLQITAYSRNSSGNSCAATSATGNTDPTSEAGPSGYVIPIETPFELTGSSTDAEGDNVTYCWEQYDLGPAGNWQTPSLNAPAFRSFDPNPSPTRVFPRIDRLVNNAPSIGETLVDYTRNFQFRLTVRDNNPAGGGYAWDNMTMSTTAAAGPFVVTYPTANGIIWAGGTSETVTWDVANTDDPGGVNAQLVDITLSVGGGLDGFPIVLASNVPNDGSHTIVVPNNPTVQARVKVKGDGNVFFDISNRNFEITGSAGIADAGVGSASARMELHANKPNPFNPSTSISFELVEAGRVSLKIYDLAGRLVMTLVEGTMDAGEHARTWDGRYANGSAAASGIYLYQLESGSETVTRRMVLLK